MENKYYLYFSLIDFFRYSKAKTGSTFPNMNKGDFSSILTLKPERNILKTFHEKIETSIDLIFNNSLENKKLIELRDWLLPMLMNGQVRVG